MEPAGIAGLGQELGFQDLADPGQADRARAGGRQEAGQLASELLDPPIELAQLPEPVAGELGPDARLPGQDPTGDREVPGGHQVGDPLLVPRFNYDEISMEPVGQLGPGDDELIAGTHDEGEVPDRTGVIRA